MGPAAGPVGGAARCAPAALQGAIECSQEMHPTGERYSLALLSRRSRRHPGTRYLARGLNEAAGPGNEIECELIMWTHPGEDGASGGAVAAAEGLVGGVTAQGWGDSTRPRAPALPPCHTSLCVAP